MVSPHTSVASRTQTARQPQVSCRGEADAYEADLFEGYVAIITDGRGDIPNRTNIPTRALRGPFPAGFSSSYPSVRPLAGMRMERARAPLIAEGTALCVLTAATAQPLTPNACNLLCACWERLVHAACQDARTRGRGRQGRPNTRDGTMHTLTAQHGKSQMATHAETARSAIEKWLDYTRPLIAAAQTHSWDGDIGNEFFNILKTGCGRPADRSTGSNAEDDG